jgi:hypothetical protein
MTPGLITRLQDIPGVEAVSVDLGAESGGISLRISSYADEQEVLQHVHELLVAYGARGLSKPRIRLGRNPASSIDLGVDISITRLGTGARIQVSGGAIQSARQVPSSPNAIAQGLADAWCQVLGRVPKEVSSVSLSDDGLLVVTVTDGDTLRRGSADVSSGWTQAIGVAVGSALGFFDNHNADQSKLIPSAW